MTEASDASRRRAALSPAKRALLDRWPECAFQREPSIPRRVQAPVLSFGQERVWELYRLAPGGAGINQTLILDLRGTLADDAVERSVAALFRRNEVLRSHLVLSESGEAIPVVRADGPPLRRVELTGLASDEAHQRAERLRREETQQGFEPLRDLLVRPLQIRLSPSHLRLLLTLHPLVSDGWSLQLVARQILHELAAPEPAAGAPDHPDSIQYADFAEWERSRLDGARLAKRLRFWAERLANGVPLLSLPGAGKRGTGTAATAAVEAARTIPAPDRQALERMAHGESATPAAGMLALLLLQLWIWSRGERLLTFFASSARRHAELRDLIGFFTNLVPLVARIDPDRSFRSHLACVHEAVMDALDQEVPLQELAPLLRRDPAVAQGPIFQVLFTHLEQAEPPQMPPGLEAKITSLGPDIEPFDVHLVVREEGRALRVLLRSRADRFEREALTGLLDELSTLLAAVLAHPDRILRDFAAGAPPRTHELLPVAPRRRSRRPRSGPPSALHEGEREVAAAFRRVLAVERVEANDDFFALGGTSLLVPQLVLELRRATGVEIAHSAIGSGRTVAELAREVEAVRSSGAARPASSPPAPDLRAAAALPRSLRFHPPRRPPAARIALLTGATGFLGSHLLVELLRSGTEPVFCLVRAASAREARRRLEHAIARVGGVSPEAARRAVAVRSDLSRPMLGSSAADLRLLREQVTVIVHCGCWVNFTYPYAVLEATNVRATRTLLELAAESRVDFFHLVSTAGVFDPRGYPTGESIAESDDLERSASVRGGYSQTKWVADRMLRSARERGLSANVYRPGWISGHSRTAACNARDLIWNLVKGSIQLGLAPAIDFQIGFEPVDRVSRSIVHLARREQPPGRSYHLPESGSVHWLDIVGLLERRGYRLRKVPFESWRQELEAALARGADVALAPFAPLFAGESGSAEPFDWAGGPLLDRSSATAALDSAQLPRTDSLVQVEHHIGWLQRARFLPPPAAVSPIATP